ncbi:MAG: lamin tail domain-containing protein, partial [Verrucomicrobiota bacterium]
SAVHGLLALQAFSQEVIITEIMYNPAGEAPEFVEISNASATPFDIAGWRLRGAIEYTFPDFASSDPQLTFLQGWETIVVGAVDEGKLREAYDIQGNARIFGPWEGELDEEGNRLSGNLSNGGERITLEDKNGSLMCSVRYDDRDPWPDAADGTGHSLVVKNKNKLIDNWRNWAASSVVGGSPGVIEVPEFRLLGLSEVAFNGDGNLEWVEFYNGGVDTVSLEGYQLASNPDLSDAVPVSGEVSGRGYTSMDADIELEGNDPMVFLADADGNVVSAARFRNVAGGDVYQTYPAGSTDWYITSANSRDAANDPDRHTNVVISEIMYDPPSGRIGEFLELHNRSAEAVNLSGWELTEGIDYVFPSGTQLAAGGYLVIASDLERFNGSYEGVQALGPYDGSLSNDGERVRLRDADGNLADSVDYGVAGDWPWLANGLGSSMELIHPDMDNNLSSAWRDSDESEKSVMKNYTITKDYNREGLWRPASDQEFHMHLVGEGYLLIENLKFHRPVSLFNPNAETVIENGEQQSNTGRSSDGWLFQGTHAGGYLEDGNKIHLIADGRGDNRANRVEVDTGSLGTKTPMTLTFDARWMFGKQRLITQTVDHGWSHEFAIDVPRNLGTPGAANSRAGENPTPELVHLKHWPAVPKAGENVYVSARVSSVEPVTEVDLVYIRDSASSPSSELGGLFSPWQRQPMNDDGTGGDEIAGDGIYTGEVKDVISDGQIVQFYVEAKAENSDPATLPFQGKNRPALFIVDDREIDTDLRTVRLVMSEYDTGAFGMRGNVAKYDFGYPATSNHYRNTTLIMSESEVIYGCEARSAGSPWHTNDRANLALKGKYKIPKDRLFRGHLKWTWDQDAANNDRRHNDRVARYWLYLLGHPANYNEYISLIVNDGAPQAREQVEPPDNNFLNRHFENGSQG